MPKKFSLFMSICAAIVALSIPFVGAAQDAKPIYYWVSHGSPTDPVWTYFLQGAEQWAKDTGHEVRTSFHSGDVPSQQEAVRAAITAKARGIVTSTPDPGSLTKVIAEAHAAGIPVIIMNTEDKTSGRDAYVGGDNVAIGHRWAQYLVDHGFVIKGDAVWTPVEVPGATYGVLETQGIDSVFGPLGVTHEITEAKLDQAEIITRMSDDRLDLATVGSQVIGHTGDDLSLIELGFGDFVGDTERSKHTVNSLGLKHSVGRAGNFHRGPDRIALFHEAVIDQILRPTMADRHVVAADVGVATAGLVFGVHYDNRNAGGMCLGDDLCQTSRIRRAGDDPSSFCRDRRADGFLLRRNIAAVERGANLLAGVLTPLLCTLQKVCPDRIGRRSVRNPILDCFCVLRCTTERNR